jgi:hypothetical protein
MADRERITLTWKRTGLLVVLCAGAILLLFFLLAPFIYSFRWSLVCARRFHLHRKGQLLRQKFDAARFRF